MFVQRASTLLRTQQRILGSCYLQAVKGYCYYAKEPYKQRPFSLKQQSVLLPGKDRIRASVLVEDPSTLMHEIPGSPQVKTAYDCLRHGLEVSGDGPCIGSRKQGSDKYEFINYSEVITKSQRIGSGLIQLGLKPCNDTFIGVFALNSEQFFLTVFACASYSIVPVPLYVSLGFQSIIYIINQVSLPVVIVNNEQNALKILQNLEQVPSLRHLVMMDPITPQIEKMAKKGNVSLLQFAQLENIGRNNLQELVLPKPDDLFSIPYTSGTTGVPKGVMLTHKSVVSCVSALRFAYGESGIFGGSIISYLPPAHIYEIVNQVASMYFARRIAFYSGDVKNLMNEIKIVNPTILPLVPRLMNALYGRVMEKVSGSTLKSFLLRTALKRKEKLLKRGKVSNQTIWDKLVFKNFQKELGTGVHILSTTSAPISPEVMSFFRCATGCYVFEAYGQTEVMAATMTLPLEYAGGSPGAPLPCNHIKLVDVPEMGYFSKDDFGEICIKGPNVFKGYFKNEKITQESLIDGWQHTGDIGRWLPNGCLQIVDRKKHLFKLSQGEYIAPEKVEAIYSESELVLQILVDGQSDQDYVVALVLPEPTTLKSWLKAKGHKLSEDISELLANKELRKNFLLELRKIGSQKDLNSLEQARNLAFLPEPFSVDNNLMSPTFKVRRGDARKHYESLILSLYKEGPLV
ncbi:long-chain-fatty-acid--CoA ligase 1 [Nephila pilipes]|uniref:long-chain-fatty-acid--CoA ligase n=1 Tax=Nephila pilipes TaxID=299642 RepID=A0A8X6TAP2_NEPPI|nr:long-chain-fatty-acid--CoA ligase 1 [Nephila pilipes]